MNRNVLLRHAIALACAVGILAGCATTRPAAGEAQAALTRGREAFLKNCQQCHPSGEADVGPALNNKLLPAFLIRTQVRMGLGGMPKFSKQEIGAQELNEIVVYMKQLRRDAQAAKAAAKKPEATGS